MKKKRDSNLLVLAVAFISLAIWLFFLVYISEVNAQTKLPGELLSFEIGTLEVGEHGYTSPNAMLVDEAGKCYLVSTSGLDKSKDMSTGWIKIERRKDGFYVYVNTRAEKAKWSKRYILYQSDMLKDGRLIPVQKIILEKNLISFNTTKEVKTK